MCVCVCFEFRQFFLLWEHVYVVFQSLCRSLQKSDRTRCLAISILEYNINSNSKSAERAKAFWFSEGRTK